MMNEATIRFIGEHREDDVRTLALQARRYPDVDMPWALGQIQGWQTARRKLPSWASMQGIIYPPHLSMEQCSSELTAQYKCGIVETMPVGSHETLIDLTGGFGVDFSFMATRAKRAIYVERMEHLCETALHNFEVLGLKHVQVIHGDAQAVLRGLDTSPASTLLYLDPARRDEKASRTYAIADCSPNVLELKELLLEKAHHILIKLSPMLDWHKAMGDLGKQVSQIHIVSVAGECKELLVLMDRNHEGEPSIHCANDNQILIFQPSHEVEPILLDGDEGCAYLYEPNASIMKAGCYGLLTERYPVKAVARDSHLFVSDTLVNDFPGRRFHVKAVSTMNKKELNRALAGITRANIATRNFPLSPQQLRVRLSLADGGETYIFGTTTTRGQHLIFLCEKL